MSITAQLALRRERMRRHSATLLAAACFAIAAFAAVMTGGYVFESIGDALHERAPLIETKLGDAKLAPYEVRP